MQTEREALVDELRVEKRRLAEQERAEIEGRLCDVDEWVETMARRHGRIVELEAQIAELAA